MPDWKDYKLGELGMVITGKTPSSKKEPPTHHFNQSIPLTLPTNNNRLKK
jgi:hypothetical protein